MMRKDQFEEGACKVLFGNPRALAEYQPPTEPESNQKSKFVKCS